MTVLEKLAMNCLGARGAEYIMHQQLLRNWLKTHSEKELIWDIGTFENIEALRYLLAAGISWDLQLALRKRWSELG